MNTNIIERVLSNQVDLHLENLCRDCASLKVHDYNWGHVHGYLDAMMLGDLLSVEAWNLLREITTAWVDYSRTEKLISGDIPNFLKKQAE